MKRVDIITNPGTIGLTVESDGFVEYLLETVMGVVLWPISLLLGFFRIFSGDLDI